MSKGFGNIVEVVMSLFVEAGGAGVTRGGGGILKNAARKIGWASSESSSRGRIGGHRIGGHRMGAGFGRARGLHNYDPKTHHLNMQSAHYSRGSRSGSGMLPPPRKSNKPASLYGRSGFQGAETLSGEAGTRWVRHGGYGGRGGYTPNPRSFIKYNR